MTIQRKLTLITGGFVALLTIAIGTTVYVLSAQKADGLQINLAGRQRMLSQRMTKEALLWTQSDNAEERSERAATLGKTITLFDRTVTALLLGGSTKGGDMSEVSLPPTEDEQTIAALNEGIALWNEVKPRVKGIAANTIAPDGPEGREALRSIQDNNISLLKLMNRATGAFQAASDAKKASLNVVLWSALGISLVLFGVVQVLIRRSIIRPLSAVVVMLKDVAQGEGDLTKRIDLDTRDELGELARWFNTFVDKLHGVISTVAHSTRQLAATSTEVASAAEQMARNSLAQTDQTTQVSTGIEEMTATIVESSRNTSDAAELSRAAADTAESGESVVRTTIDGMGGIADSTRNTMSVISGLAGNVQQIGEITAVIDDIADQTNLLALNAAIEAARAGEQGRGFAVVADEVRKLAERTTKATTEITEMIEAVTSMSNDAVEAMTGAGVLVDEGRDKADKAGDSLREILDMSRKVQDMIGQIATAADEQSSAAEQISRNIESIDTVTRENATGADEAAKAAEDLSRRTNELEQLVGQFKLQ